ncbi:MAG TPA: hypothetical protein VFS10_02235 [Pyrinomonadaceae bacterium]|nr:hypothetical protein [Pyrinomonadaceae bacterium]
MSGGTPKHQQRKSPAAALVLLLIFALLAPGLAVSQTGLALKAEDSPALKAEAPRLFRLETTPVEGGAQLLTVHGSLNGPDASGSTETSVPLVSILRDTLGDETPENDRLRYVWMHTYTRPGLLQRAASAVPFLYGGVGGKKSAGKGEVSPHLIDLAAPERDVWRRFMWLALQNVFFNPYGVAVKSSTTAYQRNAEQYRQAHVLRALAVLSLYEAETGAEPAFTPSEMTELQGRLMLAEKTFGGIVDDAYLARVHEKQSAHWQDQRGHNWELLRQRAEAEGLYFEPLTLPDGSATHALLWAARADVSQNKGRKFSARFLNIKSPWGDRRLERWNGYAETRHFDAEHRPAPKEAEGARAVELIPLALYGLDHPKIPSLLVDFRDGGNPKRREMSRRVIEDVTRNVLAVSPFGDVHYFLGRTVFDFVTGRRGMDINQPSRLRAYTQLKLLLALDASLDPALREEIGRRVERVSLNPLENDLEAEAALARGQYEALLAYARKPGGLSARLDRDRRAEMVPLAHGHASRILFRFANVLSLGLYRHRERADTKEQQRVLGEERQLAFHRRFLREVSKSSPVVEVVWNIEDVRRSLQHVARAGGRADAKTARAAARIFERTRDEETQRLSLNCLYRMDSETAKRELLRIYRTPGLDVALKTLSAEYLLSALREEQRIARDDAKAIAAFVGQ